MKGVRRCSMQGRGLSSPTRPGKGLGEQKSTEPMRKRCPSQACCPWSSSCLLLSVDILKPTLAELGCRAGNPAKVASLDGA